MPQDSQQKHVNIQGVHISKAAEIWKILLKHILEDPVLKIYIEGLDLLKEILPIIMKNIAIHIEAMNIINPILQCVIEKLVK